ncbi:MAG: response regulator [bacterium]
MGLPIDFFGNAFPRQILDAVENYIAAFDQDHLVLFANRAALKQCGKSQSQVLGLPILEVFPHLSLLRYDGCRTWDAVLEEFWQNKTIHEHQADPPDATKNGFRELHRFFPLLTKNAEGYETVAGAMLMITPLPHSAESNNTGVGEKKTVTKNNHSVGNSIKSNQQSAVVRFAMATADRINTPLNVILGHSELIRDKIASSDPSVLESFDVIHREVQCISNIIAEMNRLAVTMMDDRDFLFGITPEAFIEFEPVGMQAQEILELQETRRILVVDDEEHMLSLLRDVVASLGYTPVSASNGIQALEQITSQNIDLVITDINMPEMSGITLLEEIKHKWPSIPVILITGYGKERAAAAAKKHNADGFIGKPFQINELHRWIQQLLN